MSEQASRYISERVVSLDAKARRAAFAEDWREVDRAEGGRHELIMLARRCGLRLDIDEAAQRQESSR